MIDEITLTKGNLSRHIIDRGTSVSVNRRLWQIGASLGLLSGIAVLFGTVFTFITEYFYSEKSHGVWMIFVAFVLLAFGAHCLDKIEEMKQFRRLEFCRRHEISIERLSKEIAANTEIENS